MAQAPLCDPDLAALLNWMMGHLTEPDAMRTPPEYSAAEVGRARSRPLANVKVTRAHVLRLLASRCSDTDRAPP